jgi:hypothetical protein
MGNFYGFLANAFDDAVSNVISTHDVIHVGRVDDIILDENYPDIKKYGGLNSIGTVFFKFQNYQSKGTNIAKPFFPQLTSYPLIDELILIIQLPNIGIGKVGESSSYYYINSINLWGHPHHNGYPDLNDGRNDDNQRQEYLSNSLTKTPIRRINDSSSDIEFNTSSNKSQNTFNEKTNIHPLQPFTGDNMFQGRWGNSLRLGSTARPSSTSPLNRWSDEGENGNPITIIRNGQPEDSSKRGWEPISEDINRDLSSIYLTSTQKIPIETSSKIYNSYTTSENEVPKPTESYTGKQVIINSGRLLLNTNLDHLMLSSKRTISFNAQKGFNFDTPSNFVVEVGTTVKLGSKDATESLVKGDTLYRNLDFMLASLIQLVSILEFSQMYPGGIPIPDSTISTTSTTTKEALKEIKSSLKNILSKTCKTI